MSNEADQEAFIEEKPRERSRCCCHPTTRCVVVLLLIGLALLMWAAGCSICFPLDQPAKICVLVMCMGPVYMLVTFGICLAAFMAYTIIRGHGSALLHAAILQADDYPA